MMSIFKGKRVLVTGGAGFIGSHLVERLLELGSEVVVADNFSRGSKANIVNSLNQISLLECDLTQLNNCLASTKEVAYVFHLAATVGGIHYIQKENVEGLTPSVLMNINMLEAARINNVERFLFSSSACVYREKSLELNQFREEDAYPAKPLTTYGWAKLLGEIACKAYYQDYGIKSSCPRIFNAYGENESLDPRSSHVIPSTITKVLQYPKVPFTVFGDGQQERAFLYVKDCVEGLLRFMETIESGDPVNLGAEELTSIRSLINKTMMIAHKQVSVQYDLSGPQGTHRYCANTEKMKKMVQWTPKTCLDEGLKRTYEWIKAKLDVE